MLEKTPNRAAALKSAAKTLNTAPARVTLDVTLDTAAALMDAIKTLRDYFAVQASANTGEKALRILGEQLRRAKFLDRNRAQMKAVVALVECVGKEKWPQRKRSGRRQTAFRDLTIATAVGAVALDGMLAQIDRLLCLAPSAFEKGDGVRRFSITRNCTTQHPSACSIVRAALAKAGLHLSERTIEEIWSNQTKPC
jgi:hypothetical protein